MAESFRRCVVLPLDREWIPAMSIGRLVSDAVVAYLAEKHVNDEVPEHDPDLDPVAEAQMAFGFNDESTEPDSVRRAILESRAAGQIVVREAEGFGVIRDDNVMRGVLARDDLAKLLAAEWRIALVAPGEPADSLADGADQQSCVDQLAGPQDLSNQPAALGAEVQPDPADEAEQRIEDEQSVLRERLIAERAQVEAISATTLSEHSAKRQELERIDGELHDLDGVMPSEHPNWAAAQLARIQSGNQPFEPIFSLHIGPDERLFAVGEVPAMTARAEYSRRYSGNEAEMTTDQRVDRLMIEGLHRDKLMASVRGGHVTPYSGGLMHPSPRQWDPSPGAGYVLPIGELRKFAMLLLMDVQVMQRTTQETQSPGLTAPLATTVHKLTTKTHALAAVIEKARQCSADANDYQSVWAALVRIAQAPDRPAPVIGYVDREGVQYQTAEREEPRYFTKKALKEQFSRAQAR